MTLTRNRKTSLQHDLCSCSILPSTTTQSVTLLIVFGVPSSNHDPDTDYPDRGLRWFSSVPPCRVVPSMRPRPFRFTFIIIVSFELYSLTSTLVSCLAYSSTLKMEAKCSSEVSVDFRRTTRRYTPEDGTLDNHRFESLKSCVLVCY
jgi:hypothetical protein